MHDRNKVKRPSWVKAFLGRRAVWILEPDASSRYKTCPFADHSCSHPSSFPISTSNRIEEETEAGGSHGGVDRAHQGVRLRRAGAGGLCLPQLLDELPGRQGPQEVQGVLPDHVRRRVGEQGRQALQLRAEGAPELSGDDAHVLRHAAAGRPAAPDHRRRTGRPLRRREVLLLQGIRHRRSGQPSQDWGAQLLGGVWADHLHCIFRHQLGHQGDTLNFRSTCELQSGLMGQVT